MQCAIMQYGSKPCHAMPCHALPCHALPCHALPNELGDYRRNVLSYYARHEWFHAQFICAHLIHS
jgi:hypothetical protein